MLTLNVDKKVHCCHFKYQPPLLLCLSILPLTSFYILVSSLARHSERGKKTRQTEEGVGRQHQGMDRPGVHRVPDGSGKPGNMKETGCEIICGAPTTLAIKELMMIMMKVHQSM